MPLAETSSSALDTSWQRTNRIAVAGVIAGLVGGAVMTALMIVSGALDGGDLLAPLRPMSDVLAGPEGRGGPTDLAVGLAAHLLLSAGMGVLFVASLPVDFPPGSASVVSVAAALVVMALITSLGLPATSPQLRDQIQEFGGAWVLAHAAYGATTGAIGQRIRQRRARARTTVRARAR